MTGDLNHARHARHVPDWLRGMRFVTAASLGFGSLLFVTQHLASEHGIIPRWIGLSPFPSGALLFVALLFAALLSKSRVRGHDLWSVALVSCSLFLLAPWPGVRLLAANILVVYVGTVWHASVQFAATCPPGRVFGLGMIFYMFTLYWSIATVAYNFMPFGGSLAREVFPR